MVAPKPIRRRCWLREVISDSHGQADIAYVMIGALGVAAIVSLMFICWMSHSDYLHCISTPTTMVAKGDQNVTSIVPCRFDPLPIGQAAGLIFAAFATLIGALAGYMAVTRRGEYTKGEPNDA